MQRLPEYRSRRATPGLRVLVSSFLLWPSVGAAQTGGAALHPLAPDHWSYGLAAAVDAIFPTGEWSFWSDPPSVGIVLEALETPAAAAADGAGRTGELWSRLLREETGVTPEDLSGGAASSEASRGILGSVRVGYEDGDASLFPERGAHAGVTVGVPLGRSGTLWADGLISDRTGVSTLRSGGLAVDFAGVSLLAGRIPLRVGQGLNRPTVAGNVALDGLLVRSRGAFRLPGALGGLGRLRAQLFVAPDVPSPPVPSFADRPALPAGDTWFLSWGVQWEPHARFTGGLTTSARFGGKGRPGITPGRLLGLFTGGNEKDEFDDGQGELSARVRWGVAGQPLATYATFAFEDFASLWEDSGLVVGTLLPIVTRGGVLSLRYEYAGFGRRAHWCRSCEYVFHAWYQSPQYGSYTVEGLPVATTLGGYGAVHTLELAFWSALRPLRWNLRVFDEDRESQNLFFARWPGHRRGGTLSATYRFPGRWRLSGDLTLTDTESGGENRLGVTLEALDLFRRGR